MKFRIVEYIHHVDLLKDDNTYNQPTVEYVIEKKKLFGWEEVVKKELIPTRVSHKTYEDAEAYLYSKYMGHGYCKKIGNVYEYHAYTYYM